MVVCAQAYGQPEHERPGEVDHDRPPRKPAAGPAADCPVEQVPADGAEPRGQRDDEREHQRAAVVRRASTRPAAAAATPAAVLPATYAIAVSRWPCAAS